VPEVKPGQAGQQLEEVARDCAQGVPLQVQLLPERRRKSQSTSVNELHFKLQHVQKCFPKND
jgi:hypothetical protein